MSTAHVVPRELRETALLSPPCVWSRNEKMKFGILDLKNGFLSIPNLMFQIILFLSDVTSKLMISGGKGDGSHREDLRFVPSPQDRSLDRWNFAITLMRSEMCRACLLDQVAEQGRTHESQGFGERGQLQTAVVVHAASLTRGHGELAQQGRAHGFAAGVEQDVLARGHHSLRNEHDLRIVAATNLAPVPVPRGVHDRTSHVGFRFCLLLLVQQLVCLRPRLELFCLLVLAHHVAGVFRLLERLPRAAPVHRDLGQVFGHERARDMQVKLLLREPRDRGQERTERALARLVRVCTRTARAGEDDLGLGFGDDRRLLNLGFDLLGLFDFDERGQQLFRDIRRSIGGHEGCLVLDRDAAEVVVELRETVHTVTLADPRRLQTMLDAQFGDHRSELSFVALLAAGRCDGGDGGDGLSDVRHVGTPDAETCSAKRHT